MTVSRLSATSIVLWRHVQKDTTLHFRQHGGTYSKSGVQMELAPKDASTYYYNDSELVRVHIGYSTFGMMNGLERDFYFHNGQLVYLYESTTNSSRMGSCGTVTVAYKYYLKNDAIIYTWSDDGAGWGRDCYGNMGPKSITQIMMLVKNL